jgi:hypothetical protein
MESFCLQNKAIALCSCRFTAIFKKTLGIICNFFQTAQNINAHKLALMPPGKANYSSLNAPDMC